MKSKKLLAFILSLTMLFTMSITVFADESSTNMTMQDFYNAIKTGNVTLNGNTTIIGQIGNQGTIVTDNDCVLDLNEKTLTIGTLNTLNIGNGKTFTVKNGKIAFSRVGDCIFNPSTGSTLNLENVTFLQDKSNYEYVGTIINANGACTINVTKCTMTNLKTETAVICTNTGAGSTVNITETNISSENSNGDGVALFGGVMVVKDCEIEAVRPIKVINDEQTVILTGNTTVKGDRFVNSYTAGGVTTYGKIIKAGSGVTFEGITDTNAVETANCVLIKANGVVTPYADANNANTDARNGDTIDFLGNTYVLSDAPLSFMMEYDVTYQNGTFNFDGYSFGQAIFWVWNGDRVVNPTLTNITFEGEDYESGFAVIYNQTNGTVTLNSCQFNLKNDGAKNGVLSGLDNNKFVVNGCTFDLTNTGRVFKCMNVDMKNSTVTATTSSDYSEHAFRNVVGKITNCIISATGEFETGIKNDSGEDLEILGNSSVTLSNAIITKGDSSILVAPTATLSTTGTITGIKVGKSYYSKIEDAYNAVEENGTIDLNGYNAKLKSTLNISKDVTIKNGNINMNGFGITIPNDKTATFEKVNFSATTYNSGLALFLFSGNTPCNGTLNITDCTMDFHTDSANWGGSIINSYDGEYNNATLNMKDTKIEATDIARIIGNVRNTTLTGTDSEKAKITLTNTNPRSQEEHAFRNVYGTISGYTITADGLENGIKNTDAENLTIKDNSNITFNNTSNLDVMLEGSSSITIENGSFVTTTKNNFGKNIGNTHYASEEAALNAVADKVQVKFVATDDKTVYDIVVVPAEDGKVINRLTSAEFDFYFNVLTDGANMNYTITGANGIVATVDKNNHALFHFDGVTDINKSGVEVKLGTVKIGGYGEFEFGISTEEGANNIINTTTLNDNINYSTTGDNLVIDGGIQDEFTVPTNKLTVEIEFPQAVKDNASGYQQMNVKVVGGTTNTEKDLGGNMTADGKYVVTFDLPENTQYMVEVTGEGYRTARYNVNMNADKTLHFWNNVKDNATEVEESNTESKETVTFLAGEIVKDGKINIYDLSAVVSYFGMKDLNTRGEEYYKYAAYDLNRDGVIDSKDISIVLDAFGN